VLVLVDRHNQRDPMTAHGLLPGDSQNELFDQLILLIT
jgi:hypothetical protein